MEMNILEFNNIVPSLVGGAPVDSETPIMISSISRICWLSFRRWLYRLRFAGSVFEYGYMDWFCVVAFIRVNVHCNLKKKKREENVSLAKEKTRKRGKKRECFSTKQKDHLKIKLFPIQMKFYFGCYNYLIDHTS